MFFLAPVYHFVAPFLRFVMRVDFFDYLDSELSYRVIKKQWIRFKIGPFCFMSLNWVTAQLKPHVISTRLGGQTLLKKKQYVVGFKNLLLEVWVSKLDLVWSYNDHGSRTAAEVNPEATI